MLFWGERRHLYFCSKPSVLMQWRKKQEIFIFTLLLFSLYAQTSFYERDTIYNNFLWSQERKALFMRNAFSIFSMLCIYIYLYNIPLKLKNSVQIPGECPDFPARVLFLSNYDRKKNRKFSSSFYYFLAYMLYIILWKG